MWLRTKSTRFAKTLTSHPIALRSLIGQLLFIYLFRPYLSYHRYLQGLANMKMFMSHSAKDDDSYFGSGFRLPYNELLLWAVLCNFHKMALFMWERGDENLAKALVAGKLFRSLAKEMAKDELKGDVSEELEVHSR